MMQDETKDPFADERTGFEKLAEDALAREIRIAALNAAVRTPNITSHTMGDTWNAWQVLSLAEKYADYIETSEVPA